MEFECEKLEGCASLFIEKRHIRHVRHVRHLKHVGLECYGENNA